MPYKYRHVFPYHGRALGLQHSKTEQTDRRCTTRLASLAIVNLKNGEELVFPKGLVRITTVSSNAIEFVMLVNGAESSHCITPDTLHDNVLSQALKAVIPTLSPHYCDPLCEVIERDPSVFRTQAKDGWVISDVLAGMSGGVRYTLQRQLAASMTDQVKPDNVSTGVEKQGAFDF